jgi:hypothetical protein
MILLPASSICVHMPEHRTTSVFAKETSQKMPKQAQKASWICAHSLRCATYHIEVPLTHIGSKVGIE